MQKISLADNDSVCGKLDVVDILRKVIQISPKVVDKIINSLIFMRSGGFTLCPLEKKRIWLEMPFRFYL